MFRTGLFVLCVFGFAHSLELPHFVKKCRLANFKECAFAAANEVLPIMYQGVPEFGVPNFFPYKLGPIDINESNLKISLKNCELHGIDTLNIDFLDFSEPVTTINFTIGALTMTGNIDKESHLFESVLPRGGVANFTIINAKYGMVIQYVPRLDAKGVKYLDTKSGEIDIALGRTSYSFSETKNGTPYISVENSDPINKLILPKFKDALYKGFLDTASKFTDVLPLQSFFIIDPPQ